MEKSFLDLKTIVYKYRKNNNLSQKEMANILNISVATLKKVEKNGYIPGAKILDKFLKLKKLKIREKKIIREFILKKKKGIVLETKKEDPNALSVGIDVKKLLEFYSDLVMDKIELSSKNNCSITKKNNVSFKEAKKLNSLKNDYETVNRIAKLLFEFNDNLYKNFGELDLLLSTNKISENKKMEKGLKNLAYSLNDISKKILRHIETNQDNMIIEEEEI